MRFVPVLIVALMMSTPSRSFAGIISGNSLIAVNPSGTISGITLANTGDPFVKTLSASIDDVSQASAVNVYKEGASFEMQFSVLTSGAEVGGVDANTINFTITNGTSDYRVNRFAVELSENSDGKAAVTGVSGPQLTLQNWARSSSDLYYLYSDIRTIAPGETLEMSISLNLGTASVLDNATFNLKFDFDGSAIPEPSSILMSGLGLAIFGFARRRRNRAKQA